MQTFAVFCLLFVCVVADYYATSNYFCRELNRQTIVDVTQLQGIWYLIEQINHTEEVLLETKTHMCPIIHISKHQDEFSRPLKEKNYETRYIPRYSPEGEQTQYKGPTDRHTTPNYKNLKQIHSMYIKYLYELRYLRMYWDVGTHSIEYKFRYTIDRPGFWISCGFDDGILPRFAGTVQVMKAVGSHLVLTFCYSLLEEKQLFTIILSRREFLDHRDVMSVRRLLAYQGLQINSIEKSCNGAALTALNSGCLFLFAFLSCWKDSLSRLFGQSPV